MRSVTLQRAFLGSAAAILCAGMPMLASAQEAGVETVVVTGSRIHRAEADQPNPVVSVSAADIEHSGQTNLTDYLKRIPALAGSLGDFSNSGYNTHVSDDGSSLGGLNLLDLRNLGYVRTLVLIDGKRAVGQATGSTAIDVDSIPVSMVDRVEVVTGGSSAVYGADGVSGVVNFIMKHDFEGVQGKAQYGTSQDGGGSKYMGSVAAGHNFDDGKGNISLAYEYQHQDTLYYTQRDFTKVGGAVYFVTNPANKNGRNRSLPANIPTNDVQFVYSAPTGALDTTWDGNPDHLGNGQVFNLGTDIGSGSAIGSSGMPWATDLQGDFQPLENRHLGYFGAHYDFSRWLTLSATFNYAHIDTWSRSTAVFDDDVMIRATNAFLPADVKASILKYGYNGMAALSEDYLQLRNAEQVNRDTYRPVIEAKGELPAPSFISNATYDLSYVYGHTDVDDVNLNNRNTDRFVAALDSVIDPKTGKPTCRSNLDPTAVPRDLNAYYGPGNHYFTDTQYLFPTSSFGSTFTPGPNSGCVPFNPFDPNYNNKASIAWFTQDTHTRGALTEHVVNGFVNGDFDQFKDWGFAGPLSFVLGGEYREEESSATPDAITEVPGLFWFGGTAPVSGSFNVSEAFGELSLPVIKDRFLIKELTVDAAGRLSHYSTAGDNQSWKLDALYSPFEGLKFRASDAIAVRAPNIGELFAPQQLNYAFIDDPCDVNFITQGTQYRKANCQAIENALLGPGKYTAGVTSTETDQSTLAPTSGNPLLQPEVARTITLGAVVQPPVIPGLTVTADWYRVKITNAIEAPTAQDVAKECVDLSTVNNPFCAEVTRTAGGRFPGSIQQVATEQINVAQFFTQGVDFTVDYAAPLGDWFDGDYGDLDFHLIGNHLDTLKTTPLPGETPIESSNTIAGGVDGEAAPYWSMNLDFTWHRDRLTLDYNVDWSNGVLITDRQTIAAEPNYVAPYFLHTSDRNVHSIQAGYDVTDDINVYAGIDNLWYQKPSYGNIGYDYPVDPMGRFFYAGVKANYDPF